VDLWAFSLKNNTVRAVSKDSLPALRWAFSPKEQPSQSSVKRLTFCSSFCRTGDQVTISYMAPLSVPVKDRQQRLQNSQDFTCVCPRCTVEGKLPSSIQTKIQAIHALLRSEAQHQLWHSPAGEEYASRLSLGLGNRLLSVRYGDVGLCSPESNASNTHSNMCADGVVKYQHEACSERTPLECV